MVDNKSLSQGSPAGPAQPPGKKPAKAYQRPQILSREPLEAMAATCTASSYGKPAVGICSSPRS